MPLINDFRLIWNKGVTMFDAHHQESFQLHALFFYTINDFLAYKNLFKYSVKGYKACLIYENDTSCYQLKYGKKIVYLNH